eukprot:MONOS_4676.1-p1 / transcript=MONOS_4676.1 / gene=MONOS_4676 / organism=Monocercomonoides_exilis_PA203 / gene_product=U1 small nuclear ribonucleoprotein 70 kDa / transcript_product=U1 small nuclear ribonucleoprotein 70 kDa / location=Mono_scaffold00126:106310-106974(-) / protein_length=183 / sequence_SO=supercontig / SO=protein_coding / is_pseudo=false
MTGISDFMDKFSDEQPDPEQYPPIESVLERRIRIMKERKEIQEAKIEEEKQDWDPSLDSNATPDPSKTIFVARLDYQVTEGLLRRAFSIFGEVTHVRIVKDKKGKPRGYAFVQFRDRGSYDRAFRDGDGMQVGNRRVLVDAEKGRLNPRWKPRRFGGGKGSTRIARDPVTEIVFGYDLLIIY